MSDFKEDLELQLENIFDSVIRGIKSEARPELYEDRQRYKRDVEFLDAEIAKLQEESSSMVSPISYLTKSIIF